jgi:heterodisulfide reductase subunit A2
MKPRVGIYICSCGTNISETLDVSELAQYSSNLDDVAYVKVHNLLCSEEGRNFLTDDVMHQKPDRVVIAACTPKEHEKTFRNALRKAKFNPYLFQMVNLREQVAWVTADKSQANEKAQWYIRAAVKRVVLHEPLEQQEIDCNSNVLIIGAGVAGMEAALLLAQSGRKVCLIEKNSFIGGKVIQYEEVFPTMECSSCMLEPKMDEVLHHENIELLTLSEVQEVLGFVGNFTVRIEKKAGYVDKDNCVGCGACYEQCPVSMKNAFDYNLSDRKAIDLPFQGALPNVPLIDKENCLRFRGQDCTICKQACHFDAIDYDERDEVIERNIGGIIVATGFELLDPSVLPSFGYGRIPEVYTSLEFERILSQNGPTMGKILMKNAEEPKSLAIIHCVGSRDKGVKDYCSSVCCLYAVKFAHIVRKRLSAVKVYDLYADWCVPGKDGQPFLSSLSDLKNFNPIRTSLPMDVTISQGRERINISCIDISGKRRRISVDMVVLCPAMIPATDSERLSEILSISQDKEGFFAEGHKTLEPVSTTFEGILIAGCAQGPKDIQGSIAQGAASAGTILSMLVPGKKLELNAITAEIKGDACAGCMICLGLCPYKAISFDREKGIAVVNTVLCKGCGTCVAACPSGSARSRHFTNEQVCAEIVEVLR